MLLIQLKFKYQLIVCIWRIEAKEIRGLRLLLVQPVEKV